MVLDIWKELHIEPTKNQKLIKKAYAIQVKECHPEEFPEEFKRLRMAYERALKYAEEEEELFEEQVFIERKAESNSSREAEKVGRLVEEALSKVESAERILPPNVPNEVEAMEEPIIEPIVEPDVKPNAEDANDWGKLYRLIYILLLIFLLPERLDRIEKNHQSAKFQQTIDRQTSLKGLDKKYAEQRRQELAEDPYGGVDVEFVTRVPTSFEDTVSDSHFQKATPLGNTSTVEDVKITCLKAEIISLDSAAGQSGQLLAVSVRIENQREEPIYAIDTSDSVGEQTEPPVLYTTLLSKSGNPYDQTEIVPDSAYQSALWEEIEPGGMGEGLIYFIISEEMLAEQCVVLQIHITKDYYGAWGIDFLSLNKH